MRDESRSALRRIAAGLTRAELARFDVAIETTCAKLKHRGAGDEDSHALATTELDKAKEHRRNYELEAAWSALKAAEREMLRSASAGELAAIARAVCHEASEKLSGWRCESAVDLVGSSPADRADLTTRVQLIEAILQLSAGENPSARLTLAERVGRATSEVGLDNVPGQHPDQAVELIEDALGWPVSARERHADLEARVIQAKGILDEHSDNVYRKFRLLRSNVVRASALLALVLAILVVVVASGWVPDEVVSQDSQSPMGDWQLLLVVMVLGALGGLLSGAFEIRTGHRKLRVPALRTYYTLIWMRPVVGAAGAVIVITILQSGLNGIVILDTGGVLPLAIVAGFTERLVSNTISSAADAASN